MEIVNSIILILLYGLSLGFVYALIAIGLSLVYGYMGVINLGHGIFYALGAYLVFTTLTYAGSFWAGILVAFPVVMFLGLILERTFIRRLYGKDVLYSVVMTLGLQMILIDVIKMIWGLEPKAVGDPIGALVNIPLLGFAFPIYRLFIILMGSVLYFGLWLLLTRTMIGKVIIAGIEDLQGVQALGINPQPSFTLLFAIGAGLAALSGVIYAPIIMPYPYMGFEVVLYAFATVAMGGLANIKGTLVAALIIGETMAITGYIWSPASSVIPFIVLAVIFAMRPEGLFGG